MSEQLGRTVSYVEGPATATDAGVTDEGMDITRRGQRERGETEARSRVFS